MLKLGSGLAVILVGLAPGGCTVKECDPDREDCAVETDDDSDTDTATASDTGTDTGTGTGTDTGTGTGSDTNACVSSEWDPAVDDTCADDHKVHTCDADVLVDID